MSKDLERQYRKALAPLNLTRMSRETGRSLRSLESYRSGARRPTEAAAEEMIAYLRAMSATYTAAASKVEAALEKRER